MARPQKQASDEVRRALDGPSLEHDQLIGKIDRWNGEDSERASSAAETRGNIGQFTEQTGLNPKALSVLRQIKKVASKNRDKGMDFIRSLKAGLPMIEADIGGQQSEMDLEPDEPEMVDPDQEIPEEPRKPSYAADFNPGDPEIEAEALAFDDHLATVAEAAE